MDAPHRLLTVRANRSVLREGKDICSGVRCSNEHKGHISLRRSFAAQFVDRGNPTCTVPEVVGPEGAFNESQFAHASVCQLYGCGNGNGNRCKLDNGSWRSIAMAPTGFTVKPGTALSPTREIFQPVTDVGR